MFPASDETAPARTTGFFRRAISVPAFEGVVADPQHIGAVDHKNTIVCIIFLQWIAFCF
jgi:hypothetical protein